MLGVVARGGCYGNEVEHSTRRVRGWHGADGYGKGDESQMMRSKLPHKDGTLEQGREQRPEVEAHPAQRQREVLQRDSAGTARSSGPGRRAGGARLRGRRISRVSGVSRVSRRVSRRGNEPYAMSRKWPSPRSPRSSQSSSVPAPYMLGTLPCMLGTLPYMLGTPRHTQRAAPVVGPAQAPPARQQRARG